MNMEQQAADSRIKNGPRHHVLFTGTGRAGTTFLIKLLTELGLDTGFSPKTKVDPNARAGLERSIDAFSPYIVKSPRLAKEIETILNTRNVVLDHVFVPVRDLTAAAKSRIETTRSYLNDPNTAKYVPVDKIPGGLTGTDDPGKQETVLLKRIYNMIEQLAKTDINVTFLHYPRLVTDVDYLYAKLKPILQDISPAVFRKTFHAIVDPKLVHSYTSNDNWQAESKIDFPVNQSNNESCISSEELTATLFYDTGNGFSEEEKLTCKYAKNGFLQFDLSKIKNIKRLRLDPCEAPMALNFISATGKYGDRMEDLKVSEINSINNIKENDWLFDSCDPQILFDEPAGDIDALTVKMQIICIGERISSWLLPYKIEQLEFLRRKFGLKDFQNDWKAYQQLVNNNNTDSDDQEQSGKLSKIVKMFLSILKMCIKNPGIALKLLSWRRMKFAALTLAGKHESPDKLIERYQNVFGESPRDNNHLDNLAASARSLKGDVLIFPENNWNFRMRRPQHIASGLGKAGFRVFYFSPEPLTGNEQGRFKITLHADDRVFVCKLNAGNGIFQNITRKEMNPEMLKEYQTSMQSLFCRFNIQKTFSILNHPFWKPLADALPDNITGYDCCHIGSENFSASEKQLIRDADFAVAASENIRKKISAIRDCTLIPNASSNNWSPCTRQLIKAMSVSLLIINKRK